MPVYVYDRAVNQHYARRDLEKIILDSLQAAGIDLETLTHHDLAPLDQFHTRGKEATLNLAALAGLRQGQSVLDVGGGLGGAARTLAAEYGCQATVLDITEDYIRIGQMLTERTGLTGRVTFRHGDALEMPFPEESFDLVWTQHITMNVENKERLFAEIHRVLKPGGRLALYEIMAASAEPIHFPVPWAQDESISFLRHSEAVRALIHKTGFHEVAWMDLSEPSLEWFRARAAASAGSAPPVLGLHVLMGERFLPAFQNQVRNLAEERIAVIQAVFDRADQRRGMSA